MMKYRIALIPLLLLAICSLGHSADIGNYKIPGPATFAGSAVESGVYAIQLEEGAEGPFIQLSKAGNVVAKDLAIVIPAKGAGKTSVQVAKIAGQEFVRIRIRHGENWYYAYLQKTR